MSDEFSSVTWDKSNNEPHDDSAPDNEPTATKDKGSNGSALNGESDNGDLEPYATGGAIQPGNEITAGSAVAAAESSSSRLRADSENDQTYIKCTVSDPQKEQDGTQNAYISYLITTQTNSPSFQEPITRVRRRFSDFLYLYASLLNEFPASAVPPLPDKQRMEYLKGDRFGIEFTSKRATSLGRFLIRISRHPALKRSRTFYTFLESTDWNSFKRHKGGARTSSGGSTSGIAPPDNNGGVLDGISDGFLNAFSKVHQESKELQEVKEKTQKLDDNLTSIEKAYTRIVRRQGDLSADLEEFSNQTMKLASLEQDLGIEVNEFSQGIQQYAQSLATLRDEIDTDYIVSLRDMSYYIQSLKSLIKQREQKQLDYEALCEYLNKATTDRNNLQSGGGSNFFRNKVEDFRGVDHEQSRKDRLHKLEVKIDDLQREVSSAKVTSDAFEEFAINEVAIFDRIKHQEMKETLNSLADNNISFYKNLIDNLDEVSKTLDDPKTQQKQQDEDEPALNTEDTIGTATME